MKINRLVKPKILVVGPSLKMGGMERAAVNIANAIHIAGFHVVFATVFDQEMFFQLHPEIRLLTPSGYNRTRMNFRKTILHFRRTLVNERPDIVLVYNKFYSALLMISMLFLRRKLKVFISERSSPYYQWSFPIRLFSAVAFKINPPHGVIAQTKIAAAHQAKYYSKRSVIRVIPNILRPVKRYPQLKRQQTILAVGRFNDHLKGFDRLLKAYALVKDPGWKIRFVGGSRGEDSTIDSLIENLGLEEYVDMVGKVPEVDLMYATSSIFVIPSRSEGFPNALCEAMSAGMACISYDFVAGPSEIIEDEVNGILVKEGDIPGLAAKLKLLMKDLALRSKLGNAAALIDECLGSKQIVKKHIEFFDHIWQQDD